MNLLSLELQPNNNNTTKYKKNTSTIKVRKISPLAPLAPLDPNQARNSTPSGYLLKPKEGMKICDPTCGSGGMLIWSAKYVREHSGDPNNITLHGQERNYGNYGMCKMNMILHGIENFSVTQGVLLTLI